MESLIVIFQNVEILIVINQKLENSSFHIPKTQHFQIAINLSILFHRSVLTDQFFIPRVESQIPQSSCRSTNNTISFYRQQFHNDRQTLLLPHGRSDQR